MAKRKSKRKKLVRRKSRPYKRQNRRRNPAAPGPNHKWKIGSQVREPHTKMEGVVAELVRTGFPTRSTIYDNLPAYRVRWTGEQSASYFPWPEEWLELIKRRKNRRKKR